MFDISKARDNLDYSYTLSANSDAVMSNSISALAGCVSALSSSSTLVSCASTSVKLWFVDSTKRRFKVERKQMSELKDLDEEEEEDDDYDNHAGNDNRSDPSLEEQTQTEEDKTESIKSSRCLLQ